MGIGYNIVSYVDISAGNPPLSATDPIVGGIFMLAYGLFLIPGFTGHITIYRIFMAIAVLVFGYGGVIKHIINYFGDLDAYSSITAWVLAVGINLFIVSNIIAAKSLIACPCGVSGKFKK